MTRKVFEEYIDTQLANFTGEYIDLVSKDIHIAVGGYPSRNHRMPICCEVMRSRMHGDDIVKSSPPEGEGASLSIRYFKRNR